MSVTRYKLKQGVLEEHPHGKYMEYNDMKKVIRQILHSVGIQVKCLDNHIDNQAEAEQIDAPNDVEE